MKDRILDFIGEALLAGLVLVLLFGGCALSGLKNLMERPFKVALLSCLLPFTVEARNVSNLHGMIPADVTVSDTGDSSVATRVYHPAADEVVQVDCQDSDGCHVSIGSDNADNGGLIVVRNTSANSVTLIEEDNSVDSKLEMHDGSNYTVTGFGQILALYRGDDGQFVELTRWPGDISHDALEDISSDDHHTKTVDTDSHVDVEEGGTDVVFNPDAINFDSGDFDVTEQGDGDAGIGLASVVTKLGQSIEESELGFDTATQTELDSHANDSDAHHTKYTNEDSQDAWNSMQSGGTHSLISYTYDDAGNAFSASVTSDLSQYDNSTSQFFDTRGAGIGGSGTSINAVLGTSIQRSEIDSGVISTNQMDFSNTHPGDDSYVGWDGSQWVWQTDDTGSGESSAGNDGDLQASDGTGGFKALPLNWNGAGRISDDGTQELEIDQVDARLLDVGEDFFLREQLDNNVGTPSASGTVVIWLSADDGNIKARNNSGTTRQLNSTDF